MRILDGKKIGRNILKNLKKEISRNQNRPGLGVILVGNDKPSKIYVGLKEKASREVGMNFQLEKLSLLATEKEILEKIKKFNKNPKIHGIIVQLPLPKNINRKKIISAIAPEKDVDGFHKKNVKLFLSGQERFVPVFPGAIMKLIEASKKKLDGKLALIVANSKDFGEMMTVFLQRKKIRAEYVLRDNLEKNLDKLKNADVVISACGIPGLIRGEMLKNGAVVIDGGISKKGKKVLGDVDAKSCENVSVFLSPVPGGVGPVTVACLLNNTFEAMKKSL